MQRVLGGSIAFTATTILTNLGIWSADTRTTTTTTTTSTTTTTTPPSAYNNNNNIGEDPNENDDTLLRRWDNDLGWQSGGGGGGGGGGGAGTDPCLWFNFSVLYDSPLCAHFSLARMNSVVIQHARDRANRCAALHNTECVLGPEIGLFAPVAFIITPTSLSIRTVVAPRIVTLPDTVESNIVSVRVYDPSAASAAKRRTGVDAWNWSILGGARSVRTVQFNSSINIEYMDATTRVIDTELFHSADAYCVQLLRTAFVSECWEALD